MGTSARPTIREQLIPVLEKQSLAVRGLFLLALLYTLYVGRQLLMPICFAFLLYFLTYPSVDFMQRRLRIPRYVGAAIVLIALLFSIALIFYYFSGQARAWMNNAPAAFQAFSGKMETISDYFQRPVAILSAFLREFEYIFNLSIGVGAEQNWFGVLFNSTWEFLIQTSMVLIALYFLLESETFFLNRIVKVLVRAKKKDEVAAIVKQIEEQVWAYLFARTILNIAVAFGIGLMLYAFGLPNAFLWGFITGVLEFIPFIGAFIALILISFVSVISFESFWTIVTVPFAFFIVMSVQGNFITPYVLGGSLVLNKVAVVFGIFFLGWIWGVMGAFLAIPLMMVIKIVMDNIKSKNIIDEFFLE